MPVPQVLSIAHYKGDTLRIEVDVFSVGTTPADLSDAVVTAQARLTPVATEALADFDIQITGNTITATLPATVTADMPSSIDYDIEVDMYGDGSWVVTVLAGKVTFAQDVTR